MHHLSGKRGARAVDEAHLAEQHFVSVPEDGDALTSALSQMEKEAGFHHW